MRRKNKGVNITFSLYPARRLPMLAPPRRQPLIPPPGHANREPRIPLAAGPCWRRPADKALIHRRPRQQGAPNPARRLPMLAPPRRQPLTPPPGHANRAPRISPGAGPCWRRPAGNPLSHRRGTPTGRLKSRSAPAKPYPTVGTRQQGAPNPARRRPLLAPPRRQPLTPPSGHANREPRIPPGASPCWRRSAGNPLPHRRATPTGRLKSHPAPAHVGAAPPAKP